MRRIEALTAELEATKASVNATTAAAATTDVGANIAEAVAHPESESFTISTEDHSTTDPPSDIFRAPFTSPIFTSLTPAAMHTMLTNGSFFMKHGRHGRPHKRYIWLNEVSRNARLLSPS